MNISLTFRYLIFFSLLFFACHSSALEMYASSGMMGCYEKRAWNNPSSVHACLYENYGENLYGGVHDCSVVLYDTDLGYNRYASNCYNNKGYYETYVIYEKARCPSGERFNSSTIACEPKCDYGTNPDGTCMDACQFKKSIDETKLLQWVAYVYGEQVTGACYGDFGATRCELGRVPSDTTLCTDVESGQWTQNTLCHGNFQFTGNQCEGGTLFWGKDGPDTPIIPDDPIHDPDDPTGDIEDPSVLPDGSTNTVNPPDTEKKPDVEDPDTDDSTDMAVLNAIKGLNSDVNKALNDMNIDINQASADVQNQIIALNASMVTNTQAIQKQQINDNKIYENTKALIQQANADITTAVNKNTNAINGVGDDVEKIAGAMDGIAEDVSGISDILDGIANTDTSGAGTGGTCIESQTCTGFYESAYPDGLGGLVSGQLDNLKHNTIDNFVSSFGDLDLSSAKRPSFVLPVPFFGDFSFEEQISFDWVFGFIRAVLIMTSVFAARRIIFGG
ncbi:TPA: methyl-accepting chemotaxis protein [Vibrio parahaemolyticus]|nr:methyl-accepting chemotaxis protein [Vibrio parahaemolyticus]EJE4553457.1 methyl-accepting chemotaxis protein [Vibrio parahaemolyticus]MBE4380332.1 methyl-accepting chemotaxis protein [Vibrio parahaemolyticus]MBO0235774.1 methyl-accepting chemotaxis protein [Vibrio parahaemolyticus]HBC3910979.1 methyl-accepting chemotaxis protein [Vibrio parahaemolyticus]